VRGESSGIPITIGAVYPTSGIWATQGVNCIRGAQLAVGDINRAGGLLGGRRLALKEVAAGVQPRSAAMAAGLALESGEVSAVVGAYLSDHTLALSRVTEAHRVPTITESFVSEITTRGYRHVFKTTPVASDFSRAVFKYLIEVYQRAGKPIPRVALVAADDASAHEQFRAAAEAAVRAGITVTLATQFPADLTQTEALTQRVIGSAAEAVLLNGPVSAEIRIVKGLRTSGMMFPVVGLGGAGVLTQRFADEMGAAVNGIFATAAWNGDISREAAALNHRFISRFSGTFMPVEAGTAYTAVALAAEAITRAGNSSGADVAAALRGFDLVDGAAAFFVGGRIAFDATGLNRHPYPLLVQYQGGVPVTVLPSQDASRSAIL
jgi:branched-chain amino acid transport system substrate-binding protein